MIVVAGAGGLILSRMAIVGSAQAAVSYFQNRKRPAELFGIRQPEYIIEGGVAAIASGLSDLLGFWVMPMIMDKVTHNQTLSSATAMLAPPLISAGIEAGAKIYLVKGGTETELPQSIAEYTIVKMLGDYVSETVLGQSLAHH